MGADYPVGHGRPPKSTQFPKGTSGFKGRKARDRSVPLPYADILDQFVWITEDGERKQVTAEEAFLKQLYPRALQNGGRLRRYALQALDKAHVRKPATKRHIIYYGTDADPGDVKDCMCEMGMAQLLRPSEEFPKLVIEPWLIEKALARFGDRRLSLIEQKVVYDACRKPHIVRWPDWWEIK